MTRSHRDDETKPDGDPRVAEALRNLLGLDSGVGSFAETRSDPPRPAAEGARPATFGRYQLLEVLGRGGMGVVWKAFDPELQRTVALKEVHPTAGGDPTAIERFLREARAAARLRHPNIVAVYDVGTQDGRPYFTAEFVEGRSFEDLLEEKPPLATVVDVLRQVADALHYAHGQGIVHRDVKPANVLVDATGRALLADFGLAKLLGAESGAGITLSGTVVGTPRYLSPEQAGGSSEEIGPASDQFSAGVMLYEALTGESPFQAPTLPQILLRVLQEDPPPPSEICRGTDHALESICLRMLEKDPGERFPSMGAVSAELSGWSTKKKSVRRPRPESSSRSTTTSSRRRALPPRRGPRVNPGVVAIVAASVVAIAGLVWGLSRTSDEPSRAPEAAPSPAPAGDGIEKGRAMVDQARRLRYSTSGRPEEIRQLSQQAREALSGSAVQEARYLVGLSWELEGHPEEAMRAWREAIRLDPGEPRTRLGLARLLAGRAYVMEQTDTTEGQVPDSVGQLLEEAQKHLLGAVEHADSLGALDRSLAEALQSLAARDREGASRIAERAIARAGDVEGAEDLDWVAGMAAPSPEEKIRAFDHAIARRPNFVAALVSRAIARFLLQRANEGLADCEQAIWYEPTCADAFNLRGKARYSMGQIEDAERDFAEGALLRPDDASAWNNLGAMRFIRHDYRGAIESYGESIRLDPSNALAWSNRGIARRDSGDLAGALADFDAAIRLPARPKAAYAERGKTLLLQGDYARAIEDLTVAIQLDPSDVTSLDNRGTAYKMTRQFDQAILDYDESLRRHPDSPNAYANRGDARYMKGDTEGAITDLEKALSIAPPGWESRKQIEMLLEEVRRGRQ